MTEEFFPSGDIEVSVNPNEKVTVPYDIFWESVIFIPDGEAPPPGYYPCEKTVTDWNGVRKRGIVKDNDPMSGARGRAYWSATLIKTEK